MLLPAGQVEGRVAVLVDEVGTLRVGEEEDGDVVLLAGQSSTVEGSLSIMRVGLTNDPCRNGRQGPLHWWTVPQAFV